MSKITRPVAAIKSLRFALFRVIHKISRSHGLKNRQFVSNWSKITRLVAAIKSLRFALLEVIHQIIFKVTRAEKSMIWIKFEQDYWAGRSYQIPQICLVEKTIGSIHFISGIYPYGASLLTPIHFCVPSLIFGPLVAKMVENRVSETFWKYWFHSLHTWYLPLWGVSLDPYSVFVFLAPFSALWWPNIWPKMGFLKLSEKMIKIEIFIWIFLDEVGSDQSGGILSPFIGTACFFEEFC